MPIARSCLARGTALLVAAILAGTTADAADPEVPEPAAVHLWGERDKGLVMLEDALAQSAGSVGQWSLYVQMLHMHADYDFADWASRTALQRHPDDPTLLKRRINLLKAAPALDVVTRLARVPGQAEEADLIRDVVRLGLTMPQDLDLRGYHAPVARRLLYVNDPAAALRRVEEGLAIDVPMRMQPEASHENLLATKAMALAMLGRLDEATTVQKAAGFIQFEIQGRWQGLGDLLMARGEAGLALESFGNDAPVRPDRRLLGAGAEFVRVYAMASAANGQVDQALEVLDVDDADLWDRLLAIQILRLAGREEEAVERGRAVVDPLQPFRGGSYGGPQLRDGARATSLYPEYREAAGWLGDTFPDKRGLIEFDIGGRHTEQRTYEPWHITDRPSSELIPAIRADLAGEEDEAGQRTHRHALAVALFDAGHFAEAAATLAPPARESRDEYERVNFDAVLWSLYHRRAEAEAVYQEDPDRLTPARRLFAHLAKGTREPGTNRRLGEAPGVADALVQMGPPVIGPALWRQSSWGLPAVGRGPREAYLPVVAALGGRQDAPLLISLLPSGPGEDSTTCPDAVDATLRQITGVAASPAGTDPEARLGFWLDWWDANGSEVVGGVSTPDAG